MKNIIASGLAGISSALISGGPFYQSPYHFGMFVAFMAVAFGFCAIIDVVENED
jgi:hypothetical protein